MPVTTGIHVIFLLLPVIDWVEFGEEGCWQKFHPPLKKGGWGICRVLTYNPRLKAKARSLRAHPTDAELHLWYRLRRRQIRGVQFYRQKPIGNYIADFYAPAAKLVIELDGAQHLEPRQANYDAQRTRDLEQHGLKVIRFDDRQVLLETESVLEAIYQLVANPS